jgi:hypothetical protein
MQWPKLRLSRETEDSPLAKRLKRLAGKLDELPAKDAVRIRLAEELEQQQRNAATELHHRCVTLVGTLNGMLAQTQLQIAPETFQADRIFDASETLIQINASGRIVQIVMRPPTLAVSTEHFYIPYVLEARIRWFNQDLLDRDQVPEHHLYYCVGRNGETGWKYFDPRTRKVGPADEEYLADTLEQLV